MSDPAERLATYEDILDAEEGLRVEVVGGRRITTPSPLPRHSKTQRALGRFIGGPFDDDDGFEGPGGWWIFVEVDVRLGVHDIVRPDLSGWRRDRLRDPSELRPIDVVPDWVCEILSPSTAAADRTLKRDLYGKSGIPHYWIVDPEARTVEAFALREGKWIVIANHAAGERCAIPPFESVTLDVARLFLPAVTSDDAD